MFDGERQLVSLIATSVYLCMLGLNMTDQNRSRIGAGKAVHAGISRRDVLRAGATIIPASFIVPAWLTASAATTGTTFDFYISTTGNDANAGTLTAPWAITSLTLFTKNANNVANCRATGGKRIGFLPGTYDISALYYNDSSTGALQCIGGTSSATTYWGSSNSSGNYSPRTATIDGKGASGLYGGGVYEAPMVAQTGMFPSTYATGWTTIDGLRFTGFSYKGVRIGGASAGDGPSGITGILIQNCEFFGGGFNSGAGVDNCVALWIDGTIGAIVTNNWFHDTTGHTANSEDHLNAITVWGPTQGPATTTQGTVITYNTVVNAGSVFGKEGKIQGSTIAYNYIDVSGYTVGGYGIEDFTGATTSGMTQTTTINNNIILMGNCVAIGQPTLENTSGWSTPLTVYNNTIIGAVAAPVVGWVTEVGGSAGIGQVSWYNNIYDSGGHSGSFDNYGNYYLNPAGPKLWDYNLSPASGCSWTLYNNAGLSSALASYTSPSAFAAGLSSKGGINGAEAHSVSGAPTYVGTGVNAAKYQLAAGSLGKGTGSKNGTSSGASTDMGAWGNGATQIGCNLVSGAEVPGTPKLTIA
jgi:hypothetical protein